MRRRNTFLFLALIASGLLLAGGELILDYKAFNEQGETVSFQVNENKNNAILPRLQEPDLNGGGKGWKNAWKKEGFTRTYKEAYNKAMALQGAGEWKEFLKQTLIPKNRTDVFAGWDDRFLYLKVASHSDNMDKVLNIPSPYGKDGPVYKNENVDITLCTNRNAQKSQQFIIDVKGTTYEATNYNGGRHDASWNPEFKSDVKILGDGWVLTLAFPIKEWGFKLVEGEYLDINIGRFDIANKELSSMSPVQAAFAEKDAMLRFWFGMKKSLPSIKSIAIEAPHCGTNVVKVSISNKGSVPFKGSLCICDEKCDVEIMPSKEESYSLPIECDVGDYSVEVFLKNNAGETVDSVSLPMSIPKRLKLGLASGEAITGAKIPCRVELCPVPNGGTLVFACRQKNYSFPASGAATFLIDTGALPAGTTIFNVMLKDAAGMVLEKAEAKLLIQDDPFAD